MNLLEVAILILATGNVVLAGIKVCDSEFGRSGDCDAPVTLTAPLQPSLWGYSSGDYLRLPSNGYAAYSGNEGKMTYFNGNNICLSAMSPEALNVTICESTCHLNGTNGKGDRTCIPKCCPMGQVLQLESGDCVQPKGEGWRDQDDAFQRAILSNTERSPDLFYDSNYLMCRKVHHAFRTRLLTRQEISDIIENPIVWKSRQRFCVDIFDAHQDTEIENPEAVAAIFMCLLDRDNTWKKYMISYAVTGVFMILTIVFHIGILIAHGLLWKHQGCYGWTIMAFCGSQLLCYIAGLVVWIVLKFVDDPTYSLLSACSVSVIALHFSFLATYTWTLILAYEVWRKLRSVSAIDSDGADWKIFRYYCLIGFGIPLPFVIAGILSFFPANPLAEFPDLCKHYVETVAVYYGIAPTLILYSCISVFGFLTLKRLWSASKNRKELQAAGTSVGKPFYKRVGLIWKLMALMGTFLILDILFEAWDSSKRYRGHSFRFPLQTFYKMLHALAQFWIFVCSGRTWVQLVKKYPKLGKRNGRRNDEGGSHERLRTAVPSSSLDTGV